MKTCIICTPRSGSQYCEKLIASSCAEDTLQLGEYFQMWNSPILITENEKTRLGHHPFKMGLGISDEYQDRLRNLENIKNPKNITCRLMVLWYYDQNIVKNIIKTLHKQGFTFVVLTRDPINQLLSLMIARQYKWTNNENIFIIGSKINKQVEIEINKIKPEIFNHIRTFKNWDNLINENFSGLDAKCDNVRYETLPQDLEKIYKKPINYSGNKTLIGDPWEYISNKKEVMQFLYEYVKIDNNKITFNI